MNGTNNNDGQILGRQQVGLPASSASSSSSSAAASSSSSSSAASAASAASAVIALTADADDGDETIESSSPQRWGKRRRQPPNQLDYLSNPDENENENGDDDDGDDDSWGDGNWCWERNYGGSCHSRDSHQKKVIKKEACNLTTTGLPEEEHYIDDDDTDDDDDDDDDYVDYNDNDGKTAVTVVAAKPNRRRANIKIENLTDADDNDSNNC